MSNTPWSPARQSQGRVQTWVTSQWKLLTSPGHFSAAINTLQLLIRDTALAGGIVVFRGFPENSAKLFAARLGKLVEKEQQLANVGIDPRLFRAFEVQSVPTYVAVSSDFDLCAGFACQTRLPPYDRLIGNVTVDYALESFAQGSGPGARVAAVALSSLRKGRS